MCFVSFVGAGGAFVSVLKKRGNGIRGKGRVVEGMWRRRRREGRRERRRGREREEKRGSGLAPRKIFVFFKNAILPPFPASFGVLLAVFGIYSPRSSCW